MKHPARTFLFVLSASASPLVATEPEPNTKPNVLFIAVDDLNHWVGYLGRNQQVKTPNLDRLLTADDILRVPEFLAAYQRTNSGGVTNGIPKPKYVDADKENRPERYQKQHDEYLAALKKFIQTHPESVSGMELELTAVNPQAKWAQIQSEHKKRILRVAPEVAQTKFLVAQTDTDLDGRASVTNLPAGKYWISTLNLEAGAGDARLRWDVPVTIIAGRNARIELTNLNAIDAHSSMP